MRRKIVFRADAGPSIGYGHFIRTLALADMLKDDFDCVFYTQSPTDYQKSELSKVCSYVSLPADDSRYQHFLDDLEGDEIVVLDNYFYTTDYQKMIKAMGCKLVCIDDMHDKHYVADVIINHAITDESLFDCEPYTKLCLGFEYALLRKPFLIPHIEKKRNDDIVINFGGADPYNITEHIVTLLLQLSIPYNIIVILGDKTFLSDYNRNKVIVKKNLSASQMANLFENSAIGILSASSVCIEALSRNLPLIVGYYVDNQKFFYQELIKDNKIQALGYLQDTTSDLINDAFNKLDNNRPFVFPGNIQGRFIRTFRSI